MIKEQKLKKIEGEEILQKIKSDGKYLNEIENIEIEFFGDKDVLETIENNKIKFNNYLVGKYKNIYIGCLSLTQPFTREKFGLNKYYKDTLYLGQWKKNLKEGIGFLKVRDEIIYLGQFSQNQFNGFGVLYNKITNYFYFGNFVDGAIDSGIYYNNDTTVFYNGKFKNGKKNDKLCSYFDVKNNHIFIGEIKDDIFIKGYLSICKITEDKEENEVQTGISIDKIIYLDKTNPNETKYKYFYQFVPEFYDKIQNIFFNVFQEYFNIKNNHENYNLAFLRNLEKTVQNDSYNKYLERYNPEEKFNLENNFINNYEKYHNSFIESELNLNLKEHEIILNSEPLIQNDLPTELK